MVDVSRNTSRAMRSASSGLVKQRDQRARSTLLHLHRSGKNIQRTGRQCLFGDVTEQLRVQIVDVGFEHHHFVEWKIVD